MKGLPKEEDFEALAASGSAIARKHESLSEVAS
jgi:hypothetical protein